MNNPIRRRSFLQSAVGTLITAHAASRALAAAPAESSASAEPPATNPAAAAATTTIDFDRSYLYCAPKTSGIWVRIRMECLCRLVDHASGRSDEFALGVVAKTGLTKAPKSNDLTPGYDYWLIFSKDKVYTRRTHATVYCRNPTTLTEEEFGEFGWHTEPAAAATKLDTAEQVRPALQGWKRLVARTEFPSSDGTRSYVIEYPVKWADCGLERPTYRVETGPIVLLDPDRIVAGSKPPALQDFQWAHVDFHDHRQVRLLLDRPTFILSEATFYPPAEDKREVRPNPALTPAQERAIENRLFGDWPMPIPPNLMREVFSTDHYSDAVERACTNSLYAIA